MPEGHTLFALARDLDAAFAGTRPRVSSPQGRFTEGAAALDSRLVIGATSYGKHLFVEFEADAWLHVHLGLIGTFTIDAGQWTGEVPVVGAVRLRLQTPSHVADLRAPTLIEVATPDKVDSVLARLGPDPLVAGSDPDVAWARISRSNKPIAELLMDQRILAGVGNVYRSEVLHRLRLSPFTAGGDLRKTSWEAIWADLVRLMPLGVATGRIVTLDEQVAEIEAKIRDGLDTTLGERTSAVYRRAGLPCPRDGARIQTRELVGRNLFWCGKCQRRR